MDCNLLLVDDEPNIPRAIKRALRHERYNVSIAHSAAEALEVLAAQPIDVIISDHRMPEVTGAELLAEVSTHYPDTVRMMLASLYSNRAVTFFRERILPQSLEDCNKSLELDPNAEKTYIRKWRTLSAMEERDEGITCLQAGLERLPDSHKLQTHPQMFE